MKAHLDQKWNDKNSAHARKHITTTSRVDSILNDFCGKRCQRGYYRWWLCQYYCWLVLLPPLLCASIGGVTMCFVDGSLTLDGSVAPSRSLTHSVSRASCARFDFHRRYRRNVQQTMDDVLYVYMNVVCGWCRERFVCFIQRFVWDTEEGPEILHQHIVRNHTHFLQAKTLLNERASMHPHIDTQQSR